MLHKCRSLCFAVRTMIIGCSGIGADDLITASRGSYGR